MLENRSIDLMQEARRQRRALIIFILALLVLLGFCVVAGFRMLTLPAREIPVGSVADFADGEPRQISVPKLTISEMITQRDATLSEDTIFVRRTSDGTWIALLGVDTLSGCFLYWDAAARVFQDVNCQGSRYSIDGRYIDGLKGGQTPQDMVRLAVDVRGDQIVVRDERIRGL